MHFVSSPDFVIRAVTLSIQPSNEVAWGANVTLRCQAALDVPATVEFTIYKGQNVVCTQTTSSSDDMLCPLSNLKMANSGDYRCRVASGDAQETSKSHELTVAGVFAVMHFDSVLCLKTSSHKLTRQKCEEK